MWRIGRLRILSIVFGVVLLLSSCTGTSKPTPPEQSDIDTAGPTSTEVEIIDLRTKITEKTDSFWFYSWQVTLKNKTDRQLTVWVTIQFKDAEGFVVAEDFEFDVVLGPQEQKTISERALIQAAVASNVSNAVGKVFVRPEGV